MFRIRRIAATGVAAAALIGVGAVAFSSGDANASLPSQVSALSNSVSDAAVVKQTHGRIAQITSISDSSLTVKKSDGSSATYSLTADTKYLAPPGVVLSESFLQVGDRVVVVPTTKGGTTAKAVHVLLAHVIGKVTAVTPTSVTIEHGKGKTVTFAVSDTTVYKSAGTTATAAALVVGKYVLATGREVNGQLQALQVNIGSKDSIKHLRHGIRQHIREWRHHHHAGSPSPAPSATPTTQAG